MEEELKLRRQSLYKDHDIKEDSEKKEKLRRRMIVMSLVIKEEEPMVMVTHGVKLNDTTKEN